jgi:hypothetical protein
MCEMKNLICCLLIISGKLSSGQKITIGQKLDSFYIYRNDTLLIETGFKEAAPFSEGMTFVNMGGKYSLIDNNGLLLTDCKYDIVNGFSNGFAIVAVDSLYGFINSEGLEITAMKYDRVSNFDDGFADVQLDKLWGMIDTSGAEVVDPSADLPLLRMEKNYFAMKYRGFWGVVNSIGKIAVPFSYDLILQDGTAFKNNVPSKLILPETRE